ncbi:hypothetical protein GCM10023165_37030 [Variovorax defluvii]|uniref:Uncharacterized protein n=1 Tax=Variovorax defluvii TaxID=913761 RepID=A0ABP8I2D0_9BURK
MAERPDGAAQVLAGTKHGINHHHTSTLALTDWHSIALQEWAWRPGKAVTRHFWIALHSVKT